MMTVGTPLCLMLLAVPPFGEIIGFILIIAEILMMWRLYYDLYFMYYGKEISIILSVASIILPPIFQIDLIVSMFKEPKFGYKNYYNNEWYNSQFADKKEKTELTAQ